MVDKIDTSLLCIKLVLKIVCFFPIIHNNSCKWLILSAKTSCTPNISGKTKTQFLWRNELLTCPTQYKMETIAMYVDTID